MGIIILPFLLGALIAFIVSVVSITQLFLRKELKHVHFLYGFFLAISLYALIVASYAVEKDYWALSPAFRFPLFMFLIPLGIALLIRNSRNYSLRIIAVLLLISIIFSGLYFATSQSLTLKVLEEVGAQWYY